LWKAATPVCSIEALSKLDIRRCVFDARVSAMPEFMTS
jgi:hypothetical protein